MTLNLKNAERKKAAAFSSWGKKDPRRSKYESLKHTLDEFERKDLVCLILDSFLKSYSDATQ